MYKLPQADKQIRITNGVNALQGYISYTKNIDLDEPGVIKLSPPMCKIFSNVAADGGDTDFDLPVDMFAYSDGSYKVITPNKAFNFTMSDLILSEDSGGVSWNEDTRVINWVNGNWFVNGQDVFEYDASTGSSTYTSRISPLLGYIDLFVSRNSLVGVSSDNVLKQYDATYANTTDLTLADNFVITGTAYSNNQMGIITRGSKNLGDAYFFTWDGRTTQANAGYPVNDSYILGLASYKSSWALISTAGQLLAFTGSGFTELGTLPTFRFEDDLVSLGPNNSIDIGNIMQSDGDVLYVNCASLPKFSSNNKPYRPGFSGGVYCYDERVGLYHKYAPSYSNYGKENGTVSSNVVTLTTHYLKTGDEIWLEATDLGLTGARLYYAIVLTPTTIKLADTYDDAISNISVSITDGTLNDLWFVKRKDYGVEALKLDGCGLVKKLRSYDGTEESMSLPMFMGYTIRPNSVSSSRVKVFNVVASMMSNIGSITTSKFSSPNLEDNWQKIGVKYRKLSPQSSIIVKAKMTDEEPIIIGDMTLYNDSYTGPYVTWDSNGSTFETSFDISGAAVGDEIHVFDGAGSGQSAHITSINLVGTTYQVTLDESLRGISSNATSCISIEKWKKVGVITASDSLGHKEFNLTEASPTIEVKLELRGHGVAIQEIQIINKTHLSST